jgi:hypothetical protein
MRHCASMPRIRLRSPQIACAVGSLLIGWGIVRAVAPAHAELPVPMVTVPMMSGAIEPDRLAPHPRRLAATATTPAWIGLPTLGVNAPIVPVAVDRGGALGVPDDPRVVGWWAAGGGLTDSGGALVLDGHVDTAAEGPGALFRLADLVAGDAITLTASDGVLQSFRVTAVRPYPKPSLPPDVFAASATQRLVIITCGGHFNRSTRQYVDNVVAYAEPS